MSDIDMLDKASLLLGKAPKAMLFVQKRATSTVASLDTDSETSSNNINSSISALRDLVKQKKTGSIASRMGKSAGQVIGVDQLESKFANAQEAANARDANMVENNFLKMEVQYNPNSIQFTTSAGKQKDFRGLGDSGAQQLVTIERKATTFMSVQLTFEDVNIQDAFVRENLNPNVGNIKDMGANLITNLAGGYSIKEKMEGLISLLISNKTRNMVFVWANMFFHGQLNSVDATYTMFNKIGEPIKGTVQLQLRQAASGQEYATDIAYWNEAFQYAFADKTIATGLNNMAAGVSEDVSGAINNLLS